MNVIRIATRKSPLAIKQAEQVQAKLQLIHPGISIEIVPMSTQGDIVSGQKLSDAGGKGLFLKELEASLLEKTTDIAVHSMKDVPTALPEGLHIPVVLARENPRDVLVSNKFDNLQALPEGARIGTSSLRRICQLRDNIPSAEFVDLRGNVNTRLERLDSGEFDAIILAAAGLIRLGLQDRIKQYIPVDFCTPAVGQGMIGIECRSSDNKVNQLLKSLNSLESSLAITAERKMNEILDGGCDAPIAGYAKVSQGRIKMQGASTSADGLTLVRISKSVDTVTQQSAEKLGREIAFELLQRVDMIDNADKLTQETGVSEESTNQPEQDINHKPQYNTSEKEGDDDGQERNSEKPDKSEGESQKPMLILTRQNKHLGNMSELLQKMDYETAVVEMLVTRRRDDEMVRQYLLDIESYTDLIFFSRNAIDHGMSLMTDLNITMPETLTILTVGAESARHLQAYDIKAAYPENGTGAESLLAAGQLADLKNRKILVVRGIGGLTWPVQAMRERGADVKVADVYEQSMPINAQQELEELLKTQAKLKAVFLHSANAAMNFMSIVRQYLDQLDETVLVVGSERIAKVATDTGWKNQIWVAKSPANKHMIRRFFQ